GLARDCRREVSPSLGSSASAVSRGALKSLQVRCVCHSATPAWRKKLYPRRPESPRRTRRLSLRKPHGDLTRAFPVVYKLSKKLQADCDRRRIRKRYRRRKPGDRFKVCRQHEKWPYNAAGPCIFLLIRSASASTGDLMLRCNSEAAALVNNNENTSG